MSNSVLITGGLGFIGSRLAREMLKAGFDVRLGTRDATQKLPAELEGCKLVTTDFDSCLSLQETCVGVEQIVHLAALNDGDCVKNPEAAFAVNVVGTLRLIDAAAAADVDRILYLSTAHIYGAPLVGTLTEETLPRPRSMYAITHKTAEDLVLAADAAKRLSGIVIRLANGFGTPVHPAVNCWMLLANDLCRQAVTLRRLVLKSNGLQQRNFVTLADTTRAIKHFLNIPSPTHRVFNIGGATSRTVLELTQLIAERCRLVLGFQPVIQKADGTEVPPTLNFSIARARASGFEPTDDYVAEIDDCLRFCQQLFAGIDGFS